MTVRRAVVAVLLGLLAAGAVHPAPPAAAHATLVETAPGDEQVVDTAPTEVVLRFDEPVEAVTGAVRVLGPQGERVDSGTAATSDGGRVLTAPVDVADDGTHTVAWRVVSADGHAIEGTFVFHVGTVTGEVAVDDGEGLLGDVVTPIARWTTYAGATVALGAVLIALGAIGGGAADARLRRLVLVGAGVAAVATAVVVVTNVATATGRSLPAALRLVPEVAGATRSTRLEVGTAAFLAVAAAGAAVTPAWVRARWFPASAIVAALLARAAAGHAWTADARWLAVASDLGHLVAVGAWIGGLVALVAVLGLVDDRGAMARRVSAVALAGAVVVLVSGAVIGWQQVGSLDALTATSYGRLLMAKVVGWVVLVAIGWHNRRRLVPRVEKAAARLHRSVRLELVVAAAVLALAAVIVDTRPARDALAAPYAATVTTEGAQLQVSVEPARAGSNEMHLYFFEGDGRTPLLADAVEISVSSGNLEPRRVDSSPVTPNHVSAYGMTLAPAGTWTIEVVAISEGSPSSFRFEVEVR